VYVTTRLFTFLNVIYIFSDATVGLLSIPIDYHSELLFTLLATPL
jgi:hypothetical protein